MPSDLGYASVGRVLQRSADALATMRRLERFRGHFYNWYDTQSLQPLPPAYVSTVDSGNLAGHLFTLRAGLLGLADQPALPPRCFQGLRDTLGCALGESREGRDDATLRILHHAISAAIVLPPTTLQALRQELATILSAAAAAAVAFPVARSADDAGALDDASGAMPLPAPEGPATPRTDADVDAVDGRWLHRLHADCADLLGDLDRLVPWLASPEPGTEEDQIPFRDRMPTLRELAATDAFSAEGAALAQERLQQIAALAAECEAQADFEFDFLYDPSCNLLAIGFDVADRRRDASFYDLLASEARLAAFVGIALGRLPQDAWFALGRPLTAIAGRYSLISWSGSMFEYLMPRLVMPGFPETLLDATARASVAGQIEYAARRGLPWGISESGYNAVDAGGNYQYRAFGVPGLGLKRGLADDTVIAPYATALALLVDAEAACDNLQRLEQLGFGGSYGLYEAIDYTPSRLARAQTHAVVQSYMAHHQGMSLLSLVSVLAGEPMQRRFAADPLFQAAMLLLQERVPRVAAPASHRVALDQIRAAAGSIDTPARVLRTPATRVPEVQLLSNGRYHVMLSNCGAGYSRWRDLAVTRWREDGTRDHWGSFCYLREVQGGPCWSVGLPADAGGVGTLRGVLHRRALRGAAPRPGLRDAPRGRGLARGRHRAAPPADRQRDRPSPHDRSDDLCRGGAGAGHRGRHAPGVQQPVRADRDPRANRLRCCARDARAPPASVRRRSFTCSRCTARAPASRRSRPTVPASSVAAARPPRRWRCARPGRCRAPAARCSTR